MAKREFFSKIRLEHFFSLAKMQLCAKFQKNPMRGSPDMVWRTHRRRHAWVWVHSSHRLRRRDKKLPKYFYFLLNTWMLVESYPVMANSTPVLSRRCCRWRRRNRARSRVPVGMWGARHKRNCSQMLTGSAPSLRSRLEPRGKGGELFNVLPELMKISTRSTGHIEYNFLKEDHKNNFHTKN